MERVTARVTSHGVRGGARPKAALYATRMDPPRARNALEGVKTAIVEDEVGAGNQVPDADICRDVRLPAVCPQSARVGAACLGH